MTRSRSAHGTILITGASSGVGKATARLFAECGVRVFGTSRRPSSDESIHVAPQRRMPMPRMNLSPRSSARARLCFLALVAAATPTVLAAQRAGDSTGTRGAHASLSPSVTAARVLASAREVRVIFPRDTARSWGWSALEDPQYVPGYMWGIGVEGIDGSRMLTLRVGRTSGHARAFPSLAALVAAATPSLCRPGMIGYCSQSSVTAWVDSGRVVLSLRDSSTIAALFGMRPAWVELFHHAPANELRAGADSVRVDYVAPQIPEPDSALRARVARARREHQRQVSRITRYIDAGTDDWGAGALWLALGDSALLSVVESRCQYDTCTMTTVPSTDSAWTVADTSIVAPLHVARWNTPDGEIFMLPPHRVAIPLRAGRTSVRVTLAPSPSDTMPSRTPVSRTLSRDIVVTPPIARVEMSPRPDTMHVGERVDIRVRVLDRAGHVLGGAPARLSVRGGTYEARYDATEPVPLVFSAPGRRTLVASFGAHADTAVVIVVEAPGSE